MDSSFFTKIEILVLLSSIWYIVYYFLFSVLSTWKKLKRFLGTKKNPKDAQVNRVQIKVNKQDNDWVKEYTKNKKSLSADDKTRINELLKKVQINVSKWDFDVAKNAIIEWLAIDKFHVDLNTELATIYIEEEAYSKAEYIYKDLIVVHSANVEILKKLGYVLSLQEKFDLWTEIYKRAYKLDKNDTEVLNMLGQLTYYTWDYLGAIKYIKKYLKIKSKDVENLTLIAAAYEKTQNREDALKYYKEAAVLKPYEAEIQSNIARLSS